MGIRIYDSRERKVVDLQPRDEGRIAMYVCGPTVYNSIHIGNARTFVWFDFIRRYLRYRGFEVTYAMNYTDVDDKIIERAKVEGIPSDGVARKYSVAFEEDMASLGALPADLEPKATEHIEEMIKAIGGLIERGLAYEADGDVFFAVDKLDGYGKLSGRSIDDMRAGERIEPSAKKKHPLDFALWKEAKEGEPSWTSPWGEGRPGWHIECSVMSTKYLGERFDIHGGGRDLIFPHHENELAQAEGLNGPDTFVRHWLHSGLVQMESEKMSKSLGNFVSAREVVETVSGEVARYWALSGSYRTQAVFSDDALADARQAHERWRTFYESTVHALGDAPQEPVKERPIDVDVDDAYVRRFIEAMDEDFNSAGAYAAVHDLVSEGNKLLEGAQRGKSDDRDRLAELFAPFHEITTVMGFGFVSQAGDSLLVEGLLDYLLDLREEARVEKNFERADGIRAHLEKLGVTIDDTPAGARWRLDGSSS